MTTFSLPNAIDARALSGLLASGTLANFEESTVGATVIPFEPMQADIGHTRATVSFGSWNGGRRREQRILLGIIAKSVGPRSVFLPNKIDTLTAAYATLVIRQLPERVSLPRIAPDSEGDLLMVWEGQRSVLATVEGSAIHVVIDPGTTGAQHFDNLALTGRALPPELLAVLNSI